MLEKLYQLHLLNYEQLLRKFHNELNLKPEHVLIMMAILDHFDEKINSDLIATESGFDKMTVENTLAFLLENDYLEIYMDMSSDGRQKEVYRLTPFFKKVETLLKDKSLAPKSEMSTIIDRLEESSKRMLTPVELEIITNWFQEGISFLKITQEMDRLGNNLSVKNLDKALCQKSIFKPQTEKASALKAAFKRGINQ